MLWLGIIPLLAAAAGEAPLRSEWNVRDHIPLDQSIIQAHRGAGELAPENTIEAFELGWQLGCIPEADLRTTSDGVIVAFHDANLSRVVKNIDPQQANRRVKEMTWDELSRLDVGSWKGEAFAGRRVPRIADVFAAMQGRPQRRLYLDIKDVDLSRLAEEVQRHGVEQQVILASTNYELIRRWKALVPTSHTLLWIRGTEAELNRRFEELRASGFADVTQLQIHVHVDGDAKDVDVHSGDPFRESDAFLIERGNELRAHNIVFQTLPYGGTSAGVYHKLMDLGAMSFATAHPKVTWDAVRQYYQAK